MATAKKSSKDPLSLDAISNLLDTKLASLESRLESKAANLESKLARLENKLTTKMSELEGVVRSLDTKLQSQASDIQRHEDKIVTLEKLICEKIHTIETLEKKVLSTTRTVDQYKFKITDLENRSRRQNLRIIGLPEKVESGDLTEFFSNLLWEVFGAEALQAKPIIDRAHRVSRFSATGDKPRAVIVRLHYPREKELSIRLARQKGTISYRNFKFRIVEDYSFDVMKARITFKQVMAEIHSIGLKQALRYPANLRITLNDNSQHFFNTPEEAKKFVKEYRSSSIS